MSTPPRPEPLPRWGQRASGYNFADRLLAEALRCAEQDDDVSTGSTGTAGTGGIGDAVAVQRARAHDGPLEERILVRARHHGRAERLSDGLRHLRQAVTLGVLIVVAIGALAGAATARTTLGVGTNDRVNIFWALLSLLGVQTVLLATWLGFVLLRPRALAGGSVGGLVVKGAQRVAGFGRRGREQTAAAQAWAGVLLRSPVGRWTLGSISHATWLAFNLGAGVVLVAMLGTRHYTFVWETTILSPREYVPLTRALAAAPQMAGFPVPNTEEIRASQWPPAGDQAPQGLDAGAAWSGFLLGSMILYGFGPRTLLLGLCLSMRRRAAARYRLDPEHAGFSRLAARLAPDHRSLGVIDADDCTPPVTPRVDRAPDAPRASGPPAILGYEIASPRSTWPPPLHRGRWLDLGFVEDRAAQQRVIAALTAAADPPRMVIVTCALTSTPDRGMARFLHEIRANGRSPIAIVLTAGQALRLRGAEVEPRVADWREMAERAGIESRRVVEIDLDHLTDHSLERLEALLEADGVTDGAAGLPGHIEAAFELIVRAVTRWRSAPAAPAAPPGLKDQAELHEEIARLYRHRLGRWWTADLLKAIPAAAASPQEFAATLRRGADRVVGLLPPGLRVRPRWLAAGALAGALGCVAAATVVSPVAIGALPLWSGIGAAISTLLAPTRRSAAAPEASHQADFDEAVRSAALFAVLLELQGRDESTIGRILDAAFAEKADAPPLGGREAVSAWLAETRHRLDSALAVESRS